MEPNQIYIQITDKANFDSFERSNIILYLERFAQKSSRRVNTGKIDLYIKEHHKKYRGVSNYYCVLKFWTNKGMFVATNEGYGYLPTIHGALSKINKSFSKKKEKNIPKIISHQLKKIRKFPAML